MTQTPPRRRWRTRLAALALAAAVSVPSAPGALAAAQQAPPPPAPAATPADSGRLAVALVTMGPGRNIWDRFGHSAIWVVDSAAGTSRAYNYGLFDFNQDGFLIRFLRGRMWYWMAPFSAEPYIASYIEDRRSVWVQELALTQTEAAALQDFLQWNALEENRYYGYDYYRDNCSTRVRDALDRVLGGIIRAATDTIPTGTTYRSQTRRLTATAPLYYTGMNTALGQLTDEELSLWQAMFVPMEMQRALRDVRIARPEGLVPLVRSERALAVSEVYAERMRPPTWWPGYLLLGTLLGGTFVLLAGRPGRAARRGFATLGFVWGAAVGGTGLIMSALWALTEHWAAYANENLFQANLFALPLALLLPRLAAGARWAARPAWLTASLVALLAVAGFVAQALPGFDQGNAEPIALLLPVHLGVWLAVRRLTGRPLLPFGQRKSEVPSAAASTTSRGATTAA